MRFDSKAWRVIPIAGALVLGASLAAGTGSQQAQAVPQQQAITCNWQNLPTAPQANFHAATAFDGDHQTMYTIGGANENFSVQSNAAMLDLSGAGLAQAAWRNLASAPFERVGATAAYRAKGADSDMSGVYLLGGSADFRNATDDGFDIEGESSAAVFKTKTGATGWSQLTSSGSLNQRVWAAAAYDPDSDTVWVAGGLRECADAELANCRASTLPTQYLSFDPMTDAATWNNGPSGGPASMYGHTMVYDSVGKRMLAYGGTNDGSRTSGNLYALDLSKGAAQASWRSVSTQGSGPSGLAFHGAAFDATNNRMIVYGGAMNAPMGTNENTNKTTYALDLAKTPPEWSDLRVNYGERVGNVMGYSTMHNAAVSVIGRTRWRGIDTNQSGSRDTRALTCTLAPTETPRPPTLTPDPNVTPSATPQETVEPATPTPMVGQVCSYVSSQVPNAVINAALGNPASVNGWGQTCNPNLAQSPANPLRGWLGLQNRAVPYHPLFNSVIWRCGC